MDLAATLRLQRVLLTLFLIGLGSYLFVALLTYSPYDPGWSHVSSETQRVTNASGVAGAWIANLLVSFLGMAILWLPLWLIVEAAKLWWSTHWVKWPFRLVGLSLLILASSVLLNLHLYQPADTMQNAAGGVLGLQLGEMILPLLGLWPATALLLMLSLGLITLVFGVRWLRWLDDLGRLPTLLNQLRTPAPLVPHSAIQPAAPINTLPPAKLFRSRQSERSDVKKGLKQSNNWFQPFQDLSGALTAPVVNTNKSNISITEAEIKQPSNRSSQASLTEKASSVEEQAMTVSEVASETNEVTTAQVETPQSVEIAPTKQVESAPNPVERLVSKIAHPNIEPIVSSEALEALATTTSDQKKPTEGQVTRPAADPFTAAIKALNRATHSTTAHVPADGNVTSTQRADKPDDEVSDLAQDAEVTRVVIRPANQQSKETVKQETTKREVTEPAVTESTSESGLKIKTLAELDELLPEPVIGQGVVSRAVQVAQHRATLSPLPSLDLLEKPDLDQGPSYSPEQLERLARLLEIKLQEFNVKAQVIEAQPGPVVTRFELDLAPGVKSSKVTNIASDLARSLSMASVRVVEVIPGKPYIGIEVPNAKRQMVRLIELLDTPAYRDPDGLITVAMGKDIAGRPVLTDVVKAPHMLVAGTTGSGKSVAVNAMLLSMLLKYTPEQLRLILIDPKQLELANYSDIPHLLTPVVTDMKDAVSALNWSVGEMERRYKLMSLLKVRKIDEFNRKVREAEARGEDLLDPLWKPEDSALQARAPKLKPLPLIVIVTDEFADLIMQIGKKAEELITRLAQKSRAAGIHLILATQRPSVDVITGLIKANIPTRVALRVNSKIDSRTILDESGAEDMLGNGDMLFLAPGKNKADRVHGAFISDDEVNRICDAWRERGSPEYVEDILKSYDEEGSSGRGAASSDESNRDPVYNDAVAYVLETRRASTSVLQRKFSLGYQRAARLIDAMEEAGIISPAGHNGKREVLK